MKKISTGLMIGVILALVCVLGFGYKKAPEPNNYYEVYLNDESLGVINSKKALEDYINKNGSYYKKKFKVNKVYSPQGLQVKKLTTYSGNISSVQSVYKKIAQKGKFTIKGYEFTIKKVADSKDTSGEKLTEQKVYVLKKGVFKDAVTALINTFVGKDKYQAYLDGTQVKIESTGENIENVYVNEDITVKRTNIPVDSKIYTDDTSLAHYLLYGDNQIKNIYDVKAGDTITSVAFNNKISPEEVLISNPELTSTTNLLYPGQKINIIETNPQISIVEETYDVQDVESNYKTEEKYDNNLAMGSEDVIQEGVNGLVRVSQKVKKVNGIITYVDPQGKQVLKEPISEIIRKGNKYIATVGSTSSWGWPTDSGWTISSGYVWRTNPITGKHELHGGIDISGTGYGSKIYATNNGVVVEANYHYSFGNHVVINHNNGYFTLYGHMSRMNVKVGQTVARGDVIGFVGMTGDATGPHLHYEIWKGCQYCRIDPMTMYK